MTDRRLLFTPEDDFIPQPLNHFEELCEDWKGGVTAEEHVAVENAYHHWRVFTKSANRYARDLGRANRRQPPRSMRYAQAEAFRETNMAAFIKINYALEVKANHEITVEAMWRQRGLIHCLNGLTAKAERARAHGLTDRWERIRRAKDTVTNALRGGYDRAAAHAIGFAELDSATEEEDNETGGEELPELEMDEGLEVEIMPDFPSSQDSSFDRLPEPVFAVPEWD